MGGRLPLFRNLVVITRLFTTSPLLKIKGILKDGFDYPLDSTQEIEWSRSMERHYDEYPMRLSELSWAALHCWGDVDMPPAPSPSTRGSERVMRSGVRGIFSLRYPHSTEVWEKAKKDRDV